MIAAGDSLWRIAQRELGTDDPVAIHDYWQRIFQVNRSTLGPDPDLIFVGQRIKLPAHKT
jgi:nucleoid-associated protein YgaU